MDFEAFLVSSAADPAGRNLVVFVDNLHPGSELAIVAQDRLQVARLHANVYVALDCGGAFCRLETRSTAIAKKKTAARKTTRKQPASRARDSRKKFRAAVVGQIDTLPIVEDESGRALKLRARLNMNRETFARLVPMST